MTMERGRFSPAVSSNRGVGVLTPNGLVLAMQLGAASPSITLHVSTADQRIATRFVRRTKIEVAESAVAELMSTPRRTRRLELARIREPRWRRQPARAVGPGPTVPEPFAKVGDGMKG
jgi:hypothetical protein